MILIQDADNARMGNGVPAFGRALRAPVPAFGRHPHAPSAGLRPALRAPSAGQCRPSAGHSVPPRPAL